MTFSYEVNLLCDNLADNVRQPRNCQGLIFDGVAATAENGAAAAVAHALNSGWTVSDARTLCPYCWQMEREAGVAVRKPGEGGGAA